jgi:hypothetical protein
MKILKTFENVWECQYQNKHARGSSALDALDVWFLAFASYLK